MNRLKNQINTRAIQVKLPVAGANPISPVICCRCYQVNGAGQNYCTACGFPVQLRPGNVKLFYTRQRERLKQLRRCSEKIINARSILYASGSFCVLAAVVFVTEPNPPVIRTAMLLVMAALFTGLAKWSNTRPLTSMLISFLLAATLLLINTWSEVTRVFSQLSGLYMLIGQMIILYFVAQGLQAAYKADLLQEE